MILSISTTLFVQASPQRLVAAHGSSHVSTCIMTTTIASSGARMMKLWLILLLPCFYDNTDSFDHEPTRGQKSQKVLMSMDNYQRLKSIELREWHWHNLSTFTSMETSFRIFCPSATSTTTSTMTSLRISSLYTMSTMNVRESFWLPILTLLEVIWNVVSFLEV